MSDQTPAEMREVAKRLREGRFPEQGAWRTSDIAAGADALDRLAAVIDVAERLAAEESVIFNGTVKRWPHIVAVLDIARGDATEEDG